MEWLRKQKADDLDEMDILLGNEFLDDERLPGSVLDGMLEPVPNISEQSAAVSDPIFARSLAMRSEAMVALERLDASDNWRRAILADKRPQTAAWEPGACVFFWRRARTAQHLKTRGARLYERWLGPAIILARERNSYGAVSEGYWIVYNGMLYFVAPQHMREASNEESLANVKIQKITEEMTEQLSSGAGPQRHFEDLRELDVPIPEQVVPEAVHPVDEPAPEAVPRVNPSEEIRGSTTEAGEMLSQIRPHVREPEEFTPGRDLMSESLADVSMPSIDVQESLGDVSMPSVDAADVPVPESEEDDALLLDFKPSRFKAQSKGRELDPKQWNEKERIAFRAAEKENLKKHLEHKAVRIVFQTKRKKLLMIAFFPCRVDLFTP